MTPAPVLVVGSGRSTDVPSEASAAPSTDAPVSVSYTHEVFSGSQYWLTPAPIEAGSTAQRRMLLALGYLEEAEKAEHFAEESLPAQTELLGDDDIAE